MEFYNPPWDSGAADDVVAEHKGKFYRVLPVQNGFSATDVSDEPALDRLGVAQDLSKVYEDEAIAAMEAAVLQASQKK